MSHVQTNNVEEHKRVSFGGEQKITVYDDGLVDDYSLHHASKHNTPFTESDAPPNKVKVHTETSEIPRPISPPAQVVDERPPIVAITSPPLPALLKKMENDGVENPFRPTETLYHEVDPIVEAYRTRPFPPSPSGSPIPPHVGGAHHAASPLNHGYKHHHEESASSTKITNDISYESTPKGHKGSKKSNGGRNSRTSSLAEARTPASNTPLISGNDTVVADNNLPPPGKVEIVHIEEKKKKCACCSLQ